MSGPGRIDLTDAPLPAARRTAQKPGGGGRGKGSGSLKLDEFAQRILPFATIISGLLLLYLLWGLWSGAWSHEALGNMPGAYRNQQVENVATVFRLLQLTSFVGVLSLLICAARSEGMGYWLFGMAAFFYGGVPWLTTQIYAQRHQSASKLGISVLTDFGLLAWLFAVPGAIWTVIDLIRRFGEASEKAAIGRATAKYGSGVEKQGTGAGRHRQVFLGRCYEGPFCKDNIRPKCPIYLKRKGPCWWYKEGCMCEERIVLQAMITTDWKQQSQEAVKALDSRGPRKILTPEAKRERCRNCVIYNEHQRQKHKALTIATLIGMPSILIWQFPLFQALIGSLLNVLDSMTKRFSFSPDASGIAQLHNGAYSIIAWVFLAALGVILLSQALKVIEYFCFKLKI